MIRIRFWSGFAVAAALCALATAFVLTPAESVPPKPAAPVRPAPVAAVAPVATATPEMAEATQASRPVVGYDRYRTELRRIRAAREDAQALQANERCIDSQRFRKIGTEWQRAGDC